MFECPNCGNEWSDEEILEGLRQAFGAREMDWETFREQQDELVRTIKFLVNSNSTDSHNIKALRGILSTLNELQAQAVQYGYPREEVYGE